MLHVTVNVKKYRTGLWAFWIDWPVAIMIPGYVNETMCRQGAKMACEALGRRPMFVITEC